MRERERERDERIATEYKKVIKRLGFLVFYFYFLIRDRERGRENMLLK
jgi:hypothetical protein